jgi:hypothetical protein
MARGQYQSLTIHAEVVPKETVGSGRGNAEAHNIAYLAPTFGCNCPCAAPDGARSIKSRDPSANGTLRLLRQRVHPCRHRGRLTAIAFDNRLERRSRQAQSGKVQKYVHGGAKRDYITGELAALGTRRGLLHLRVEQRTNMKVRR